MTAKKHSHYHKDVSRLDTVDVYRLCALFDVNDPSGATQHAIKKLLCSGKRGVKTSRQDLQEAVDTINRRIQMIDEDAAFPCDNPVRGPVMSDPMPAESCRKNLLNDVLAGHPTAAREYVLQTVEISHPSFGEIAFADGVQVDSIKEELARQVSAGTQEPAAAMEDDSERMQAIGQNGNDGAVYAELDPFAAAPDWAQWKAQDSGGEWWLFSDKPDAWSHTWQKTGGEYQLVGAGKPNPNWRATLIQRKQP